MTFSEFIHMGGYGGYVWSAYGITLIVLALNILVPVLQRKQLLRQLALKLKRQQ